MEKHPNTTFIFCPLTGADLSLVLRKNAVKEQEILNEAIWTFNEEIFQRNLYGNVYAPNFAEPVHRMINGVRKNFLHHLDRDVIHLSHDLKRKWAKKMVKIADRY